MRPIRDGMTISRKVSKFHARGRLLCSFPRVKKKLFGFTSRTAFEYSVLLFQQHLMHLMNALRDLRLSEIGAAVACIAAKPCA